MENFRFHILFNLYSKWKKFNLINITILKKSQFILTKLLLQIFAGPEIKYFLFTLYIATFSKYNI